MPTVPYTIFSSAKIGIIPETSKKMQKKSEVEGFGV